MKPLIFLATATALLAAAAAEAKRGKLPPYPKALRCAALTGASFKQAQGTIGEAAMDRFDHALFWGLAASDAARQAKRTAPVFEAELGQATTAARAQLDGGDAGAGAELAQCVRQVPPLKRKKR